MKVYYISNMYPSDDSPYYGIFVKEQIDALRNLQVDTEMNVITQKGGSKLNKLGRYVKLSAKALWDNLVNQYDAVHLHYIFPTGIVLIPLRWITKKKLIVTGHGSDIINTNRIKTFFMKRILRSCDQVIVVSDYLKQIAIHKYEVPSDKINVIHCGFDETLFAPQPKVEKNIKTVLFLSRLYKEKGTQTFINIALHMQEQEHIHFLIVGDGPEKEHMITHLQHHPRVSFVGGVSKDKVGDYFNQADVYVFPTQKEGYGLVALESMACGTPVVASNVGGVPEIVSHNKNGYLATVDSTDDFVKGIQWVLQHETEEQVVSHAIQTAKSNTIKDQTKKVYEVYQKTIKK